jgi:hypothetical protein
MPAYPRALVESVRLHGLRKALAELRPIDIQQLIVAWLREAKYHALDRFVTKQAQRHWVLRDQLEKTAERKVDQQRAATELAHVRHTASLSKLRINLQHHQLQNQNTQKLLTKVAIETFIENLKAANDAIRYNGQTSLSLRRHQILQLLALQQAPKSLLHQHVVHMVADDQPLNIDGELSISEGNIKKTS